MSKPHLPQDQPPQGAQDPQLEVPREGESRDSRSARTSRLLLRPLSGIRRSFLFGREASGDESNINSESTIEFKPSFDSVRPERWQLGPPIGSEQSVGSENSHLDPVEGAKKSPPESVAASAPASAPAPSPAAAAGPPPLPGPFDSGWLPWLQVVGTFAVWVNSWGLCNAFGEFQTYYQQTLLARKSADQIAWIGSLQAFFLLFLGALSGPLYDAGYFRTLMVIGNLCVVLGMMMTSLCHEYWQLILAQSVLVGTGFGLLFVPCTAFIPQWFQKRKGFANGLAASGSGVGGVIYSLIFRKLQPTLGFGWTTRVMGFIALFFAIVAVATLRSKVPKAPKMRKILQPQALREPAYVLYAWGGLFVFLGIYTPFYYIQAFALAKHLSGASITAYLVVLINAGSAAGRIGLSAASDYLGVMNVAILSVAVSSVLVFCWLAVDSAAGLVVFAILYGVSSGTFLGLCALVMVPLTKDLRTLGTRIGQFCMWASLAVLVGTPISGAIVQRGFVGLQVFAGTTIALGAIGIFAARTAKMRGFGLAKKI